MLAKSLGYFAQGMYGRAVHVEVYAEQGIPGIDIIGLPDTSVKESKSRVGAAIVNSGFAMPVAHMTVNLAPAFLRKEGTSYDLAIAVAILSATGQLPDNDFTDICLIGELSLDGSVQPVRGVFAMVLSAQENGLTEFIVPADNAAEVSSIDGVRIYPAKSLEQVTRHLRGTERIPAQRQRPYSEVAAQAHPAVDLAQVQGQLMARRALEVAAAGGHNMLMVGVPGSGKTMLARCLPGILPPMTFEESLETTRIYSIAGALEPGSGLMVLRPFCAPHHTASDVSLVGGGTNAMPGAISLSHNGVLFLDELPEFSRGAMEALRQPLEDGIVTIQRIHTVGKYPSRFMFVAAMNPCPCGNYGSRTRPCRCKPMEIRRYLDRVSGPLLDRIDIQIEVDAVPLSEIRQDRPAESSAEVAERVRRARAIQQERYRGMPIHCNAQLRRTNWSRWCRLDSESQGLLNLAVESLGLSMRGYERVVKIARTIADLRGAEAIARDDVAEAVTYRELEHKYWR